jgi:hypothetical protein
VLGQVLPSEGERQVVGVDQRLHAPQVGEGREHRDLDRAEIVACV